MEEKLLNDEICRPWCGFSDCQCLAQGRGGGHPSPKMVEDAIDHLRQTQGLLSGCPEMGAIVALLERTREDLASFEA